ncbi:sigma-54-dependent Fis family transcriptional regulator [Ideonella dechloratans]|uniref:Sigma-54-dependent Fis family transcriptional regulator n=1 Tax=Ideonella dechloratans TaxID=36863 RepID=A0A643F3T6_IDEDE|nr:sigma 54-interacting transcriptional regulator [Ideonella dechloratans]KAB0572857.1 sigma-54-dependent Fis family transcriptional regulator [Ideonella dechloratans]UFU10438.1 sigma 54-interacting transcriptional regulator [Ideonella dechloratans]
MTLQPSAELTQTFTETGTGPQAAPVWVLTVIWHPDLQRVGEQAVLSPDTPLALNRYQPLFSPLQAAAGWAQPLLHASVSRASLTLVLGADGLTLSPEDERVRAEWQGQPLTGPRTVPLPAEGDSAVIQLGKRVLLCLHRAHQLPVTDNPLLLGVSSAMEGLRRQVARVAAAALPVLVRGESGTGKERVAQSLHRLSPWSQGPWVTVNMATLSEGLAPAELFGAARGAYTGAQVARTGLWAQADGGSLFLDEIGDCPPAVQPMLLRVIESGEFRPLGAAQPLRSRARLIAATDRPLETSGFNLPLLRRLQTFTLFTPSLRSRREDLGVLARQAWLDTGAAPEDLAEMPTELARALCLHDWPGNVRQLEQAMRRLALDRAAGLWPSVEALLGEPLRLPPDTAASTRVAWTPALPEPSASAAPTAPADETDSGLSAGPAAAVARPRQSTAGIDRASLLAALDAHGWQLKEAAEALGVSRPSIYNLMARWLDTPPADSLGAEQLAPLLSRPDATLADMARQLQVPREALRRRLRALGLPRPPDEAGGRVDADPDGDAME